MLDVGEYRWQECTKARGVENGNKMMKTSAVKQNGKSDKKSLGWSQVLNGQSVC